MENAHSPINRLPLWGFVIGIAAVPACGGSDMMSAYVRAFNQHASAYQTEVTDHQAAIQAAPGLSTIGTIETDHASMLQTHMTGMHTELTDMGTCVAPGGAEAEPKDVQADLDALHMESDAHLQAMMGATDIPSALAEEDRHQQQMATMMGGMHAHASSMMDGTDSYSCHMGSGEMAGGGM